MELHHLVQNAYLSDKHVYIQPFDMHCEFCVHAQCTALRLVLYVRFVCWIIWTCMLDNL
jgi:hypothetical protein